MIHEHVSLLAEIEEATKFISTSVGFILLAFAAAWILRIDFLETQARNNDTEGYHCTPPTNEIHRLTPATTQRPALRTRGRQQKEERINGEQGSILHVAGGGHLISE